MSGHRRYSTADVDLVIDVLRHRASGLAMPAAVERAREVRRPAESSVFAGLRNHHRDLTVQRLGKSTLLALCRAIEDECCAQADRPLLFAGFQRVRHYNASKDRWHDLSATARGAYVFADFADPGPESDRPLEIAVPGDSVLNREWLLVCDSTDHPGCVVGWEPPGQGQQPDRLREFETLWSLDPAVVRDASRICAGLVERFRPEFRFPFWRDLEETPPPHTVAERRTSGVFDRMLSYFSAAALP
jgi:DICT domain-containing protein